MGNDNQSNEEQLEMLLMTLEEVRHGICLFQSENQAKRVSLIQERFGKEKVIVHNIADDDEEKGMVSSQDFKRWASESDAKVVIVYNVQLLGMRFGDKFYKYAIKIREKVYGEKNELTASSYEQLAYALYNKSDYAEAKKLIDKARSIYVSLYGSQNENVRIDDYLKK